MLIADGLMRGDLQRYEHHEANFNGKNKLQTVDRNICGIVFLLLTPSEGRPADRNVGHPLCVVIPLCTARFVAPAMHCSKDVQWECCTPSAPAMLTCCRGSDG